MKIKYRPLIAGASLLLLPACGGSGEKADTDTVAIRVMTREEPLDSAEIARQAAEEQARAAAEMARQDSIATVQANAAKLAKGIVGEAILRGKKMTFKKNHTYTLGGDKAIGEWKKNGKAITLHPYESSAVQTIINGKLYDGEYNPSSGTLSFEETIDGELQDRSMKLSSAKSTSLSSFDWYE